MLRRLDLLHRYTYRHIGDELLWVNSMLLRRTKAASRWHIWLVNVGRMKTLYREGLGHRYGRLMQTIAGIHCNFSVSDELCSCCTGNPPAPCHCRTSRRKAISG